MNALPDRKRPAHGVFATPEGPPIVFLTVCSGKREPWMACDAVQQALGSVWRKADGWSVGYHMLMPDHVHLFCRQRKPDVALGTWVRHWKRAFTLRCVPGAGAWQRDYWDTRLRRMEHYAERWAYVRENPVRMGLVAEAAAWPYQGVLDELRW